MRYILLICCLIGSGKILLAAEKDTIQNKQLSIHFQATVVNQFKPSFKGKYSGGNSLIFNVENKTSLTSTLFLGAGLWKGASIFLNPEIAGGSGLSEALGIADATNGETFRVGDPSPKIYLARLFFQQLFPLSDEYLYQEDDENQLAKKVPTKYLIAIVGKIGLSDFFDDNKYSHDPRTQFLSWGLMSNGGWDYPANTRGYTPSIIVEYITPKQEIRYAYSLVPVEANGNKMEWRFTKAGSHSLEYTRRYTIHHQDGAIRLLAFLTTADMGNYEQSVLINPSKPDITATRIDGRTKYGFGINAEQNFTKYLGCFVRASWNDGHNETWMFTEIDRTISLGISMTGNQWKRANDNVGLAIVTSGISKQHQDYLKAGGKGFMLGDGNLNYKSEHLLECYYSAELSKNQVFLTGAYQLLLNPGYNYDRKGPVHVFSVRVHANI